jgi:hypothetical protein
MEGVVSKVISAKLIIMAKFMSAKFMDAHAASSISHGSWGKGFPEDFSTMS